MKVSVPPMKCAICEERQPRRHCPGIRGEICPICCGEQRENTIACPLDCTYLREARLREKPNYPANIPFSEVRISDRFVDEHKSAFMVAVSAVIRTTQEIAEAVDNDYREAFDALLRTLKTGESGLIYDTRPTNPIAGRVYDVTRREIEEGRKTLSERGKSIRDAEIFTAVLVLQRLEYRFNNGRTRGRSYIDSMLQHFAPDEVLNPPATSLIV